MRWLRWLLDRFGYVLWKKNFMVYGVLPFLDIERLSRAWGIEIRTVFDVGANEGQTARELRKAFPRARIYCFEPHGPTFEKLHANVTDQETLTFHTALGDTDGEVPFYVYATSKGGSHVNSIVPNAAFTEHYQFPRTQEIVPSRTLDRFCSDANVEHIDLLKIDTEGSEMLVLEGAQRMLLEGRIRFVYLEFMHMVQQPGVTGGSLLPIAELLNRCGYVYLASYTDYISHSDLISVHNALFVRSPKATISVTQIEQADGTRDVTCTSCGTFLGNFPERAAIYAAANHRCEHANLSHR
jgi:FkbM family methyltransferase